MNIPATGETNQSNSPNPNPRGHSPSLESPSKRRGSWYIYAIVPVLLIGLGISAWVYFPRSLFPTRQYYTGLVEVVKKEKLTLRIVERGELESADNGEVYCRVKTNAKGSTIKIKSLIDDGTFVKKGDLLLELDSTPLEEEKKDQQIKVDQAEADKIKAEQDYEIEISQAKSDILAAKNAIALAEIELKKYQYGDLKVKETELRKKLDDARSQLEMSQDKYIWIQRLFKRGYFNENQVKSEEFKMKSADRDLALYQTQLEVLYKYEREHKVLELDAKLREAELALKRAEAQAASKEIQARSTKKTKKSIWEQEVTKLTDIDYEIKNCKIYAPRDGLCIYYVSAQSRFGRGGQQNIVAQGEAVAYNQKLMQIPDLSRMIVKARINEAMVAYLRNEDPSDPSTWQRCLIRTDAYSNRIYKGHVQSVATIASQNDWMSSDVKVYETVINVDEEVEKLKPGMSAEVTIFAYESPTPVITIPIQSVVGSITMDRERKCFVIADNGLVEERDIVLGMSNEAVVEVKSGLKEGEKVALDPSKLLKPDSNMKAAQPPKNKGLKNEDPSGWKGGKGKGPGGPQENGPNTGKMKGQKSGLPKGPVAGGGAPSEGQKAQMFEKFQNATPQERRQMVNQMPAEFRSKIEEGLRKKGLEIAD